MAASQQFNLTSAQIIELSEIGNKFIYEDVYGNMRLSNGGVIKIIQKYNEMSDNFKQFSLYEHKETIATADTPISSQTEISDDRTKLHWKTSLVVHTPKISDDEIEEAAEKGGFYNRVLSANLPPRTITFSLKDNEPIIVLSEEGFKYKGEFIEDTGEVYRLFKEFLIKANRPTELSDEEWVGCDGCTETDEYFWKKGFQAGYNKAKPVEISDEEIKEAAKDYHWKNGVYYAQEKTFIDAIKWYREQLKSR